MYILNCNNVYLIFLTDGVVSEFVVVVVILVYVLKMREIRKHKEIKQCIIF